MKKIDKIRSMIHSDTPHSELIEEFEKQKHSIESLLTSHTKESIADGIFIKLMAYATPLHFDGQHGKALVAINELEIALRKTIGHSSNKLNYKSTLYLKVHNLEGLKIFKEANRYRAKLIQIDSKNENHINAVKSNNYTLLNKYYHFSIYLILGITIINIASMSLTGTLLFRFFRFDFISILALTFISRYIISQRIDKLTKEKILKRYS